MRTHCCAQLDASDVQDGSAIDVNEVPQIGDAVEPFVEQKITNNLQLQMRMHKARSGVPRSGVPSDKIRHTDTTHGTRHTDTTHGYDTRDTGHSTRHTNGTRDNGRRDTGHGTVTDAPRLLRPAHPLLRTDIHRRDYPQGRTSLLSFLAGTYFAGTAAVFRRSRQMFLLSASSAP